MDTWIAMYEDLRSSARCAVTFAALVAGLSTYTLGSTKNNPAVPFSP